MSNESAASNNRDETPAENRDGVAHESPPPVDTEAQESESGDDRRASPRRRKMVRVLVLDVMYPDDPITGWIVDRSLGGMCMSVDRPMEPGAVLRVRRNNAPGTVPWVEVRVQSVREKDETWDLGCEYLRSPSWSALLQFE